MLNINDNNGPGDYEHSYTRVPFMVWNKLEGRARSQNMDRSTKAEIYDPLWFLTRQWQLGELMGEDVGSALTAQIAYQTTRPSHIGNDKMGPLKTMDPQSNHHHGHPVAATRHLQFELTTQQRSHTGIQFLKLCRQIDAINNEALNDIIAQFPIVIPEIPTESNWDDQLHATKFHAQGKLSNVAALYKKRIPDGHSIYTDLTSATPTLSVSLGVKAAYIKLMENLYPHLKASNEGDGWHTENLGYDYKWAYPKEGAEEIEHMVMGNHAEATDGADWYGADVLNPALSTIENPVTDLTPYRENKVFPIVLTRANFPGMPARRWWEMEDGHIDLGNIEGDKTETVKQIISEFASVYSNDWFVIPFRRNEQDLVSVKGIMVKDSFGEYTYIKNALAAAGSNTLVDDQAAAFDWNLFHHDVAAEAETILAGNAGKSLHAGFVLGSTRTIASSEPIERIEFIRDEMDNRVWAVESLIASQLGGSHNGGVISEELLAYIRSLTGDVEEINPTNVDLIYKLGNTLPENYIPFVAVRDGNMPEPFSSRSIALQRGWMPRTVGDKITRVRPRTKILRWMLDENDRLLDDLGNPIITGTQGNPLLGVTQTAAQNRFLLKEELIPRTGLTITDRYYYGRDYNGGLHLWLGRSVKNGTEANSAQLSFDQVIFRKKEQV
jgi:hypothetical protein